MKNKIFLLSHYLAYPAFEDYCLGLKTVLNTYEIKIIDYHDEDDIPSAIMNPDDIYLFFSYIPPKFFKKHITNHHQHIHLLNTEQSTRPVWSLMIQHYTKYGIKIFDYDFYQATMYSSDPIRSYLPYQITENENKYLTELIKNSPKYYNVAICSVNQSKRRANIYNQLQQRGLKVIDVSGWKDKRDSKIAESQILVNIHYDTDYQIFEHFRCDRWVLTGMLVVSETSLSDDSIDYKNLLIIESYQNIVDKIVAIVANYQTYYPQYLEKLLLCKKQIIDDRQLSSTLCFPSCESRND
jgi:hypothetical protein